MIFYECHPIIYTKSKFVTTHGNILGVTWHIGPREGPHKPPNIHNIDYRSLPSVKTVYYIKSDCDVTMASCKMSENKTESNKGLVLKT